METRSDGPPRLSASPVRWLGALGIAVLVVAGIYLMEKLVGFRSPVFALNLHFILMAGAVWVDKLLDPQLTARCFDVSTREVRIYRRLGVNAFMRVLQHIGWTALLRDRKVFDGTRRTLSGYERATRHGENAHAWLFVIALAPMAWAAARNWWDAVFWIGSMSVIFHVYPILLQRTQRARLASMMRRRQARSSG